MAGFTSYLANIAGNPLRGISEQDEIVNAQPQEIKNTPSKIISPNNVIMKVMYVRH